MQSQESLFQRPEQSRPEQRESSDASYEPRYREAPPYEESSQSRPYEAGYVEAYDGPAPQEYTGEKLRPKTYSRIRQRRRWLLLTVVLIAILGASGVFSSARKYTSGESTIEPQIFEVGAHPTLIIRAMSDNIHIHTGGTGTIAVQPASHGEKIFFTNNDDIVSITTGRGDFQSWHHTDLDVTVPTTTDVQINNMSGNISLNGVNGRLEISTRSGDIRIKQGAISGHSKINTIAGNIRYDGSLDPTGTYQFRSASGNVDVTLPSNASFQLNAHSDSDNVNNDFPHQVAGAPPYASLDIDAGGSISVHEEEGS